MNPHSDDPTRDVLALAGNGRVDSAVSFPAAKSLRCWRASWGQQVAR